MKIINNLILSLLLVNGVLTPAYSQDIQQTSTTHGDIKNTFVVLTFHDVRDDVAKTGDRDLYAISTENLAQYFEWIQRENWNPIRLEDIWQARQGKQDLPPNAVLLTFDDGALSNYKRVFPLLKQFKVPAVFAIPTSWINGNFKDGYDAYGYGNLMNWNQMREMQKSGYAEFASHSDNLHTGILANPQLNTQPSAVTRKYDISTKRYESDENFQKRVYEDLKKSKQILDKELAINSRAIVWPYGAVTGESEAIAAKAGLPMSFSLGKVLPVASSKNTYQRTLVMDNPTPEMLHQWMLEFNDYSLAPFKQKKTLMRVDLTEMQTENNEQYNEKLGQLLNSLDAFQSNTLILKAVADLNGDGKFDVAYFPNEQLSMQHDLLNRAVWQARTRINHRVYAELPLQLETEQKLSLEQLSTDLIKNNSSIEGSMIDSGSALRCALQSLVWNDECKQKMTNAFKIIQRTKAVTDRYSNISNDHQIALKFDVNSSNLNGLKTLLNYSKDSLDFIYLNLDPVQQPQVFESFVKQIKLIKPAERQHLMISFNIPKDLTISERKKLLKKYQILKTLSVQKLGINNYSFKNAQFIHQNFYSTLSLNSSPLTYRNPHAQDTRKVK